jgi:hypothetical protein
MNLQASFVVSICRSLDSYIIGLSLFLQNAHPAPDSATQPSNSVGSSSVFVSVGDQGDLPGHSVVLMRSLGGWCAGFLVAGPAVVEMPGTVEGDGGRTPIEIILQTVPAD